MAELNLFVSLLILGLVVVIYIRVKPFVFEVDEEWKERPLGIAKKNGFRFKPFGKNKKRPPIVNDDARAWEKEHDVNPRPDLHAGN